MKGAFVLFFFRREIIVSESVKLSKLKQKQEVSREKQTTKTPSVNGVGRGE